MGERRATSVREVPVWFAFADRMYMAIVGQVLVGLLEGPNDPMTY